jgi:hypothetical protein
VGLREGQRVYPCRSECARCNPRKSVLLGPLRGFRHGRSRRSPRLTAARLAAPDSALPQIRHVRHRPPVRHDLRQRCRPFRLRLGLRVRPHDRACCCGPPPAPSPGRRAARDRGPLALPW